MNFLVGSGSKISLNGKYYDELELECKYLEVDQTNPIRRAVWQVQVIIVFREILLSPLLFHYPRMGSRT